MRATDKYFKDQLQGLADKYAEGDVKKLAQKLVGVVGGEEKLVEAIREAN